MVLIISLIILFIILLILIVCFNKTFVRDKKTDNIYELPPLKAYNEFKDDFYKMIDEFDKVEYKDIYTKSYDDLNLHARYYEGQKDIVALCFHGYRGTISRDFSGGGKLLLKHKFKTIIVDERSHGKSEGKIITFGIKERRDVLTWIHYVNTNFHNVKIILFGVSMGASTVLMASDYKLPKNVIGIVADSPYNSPIDIIKKVIKDLRLNEKIIFPFVYLSALIFGRFDLNSKSAEDSVKNTKLPILLIHGKKDSFVPFKMSKKIEKNIKTYHETLYVEDADHALSYVKETKNYEKIFLKFLKNITKE